MNPIESALSQAQVFTSAHLWVIIVIVALLLLVAIVLHHERNKPSAAKALPAPAAVLAPAPAAAPSLLETTSAPTLATVHSAITDLANRVATVGSSASSAANSAHEANQRAAEVQETLKDHGEKLSVLAKKAVSG